MPKGFHLQIFCFHLGITQEVRTQSSNAAYEILFLLDIAYWHTGLSDLPSLGEGDVQLNSGFVWFACGL